MSDQNMIIVMGATAVVTIVTTAAPFLFFDYLRLKRHAENHDGADCRARIVAEAEDDADRSAAVTSEFSPFAAANTK